MERIVIVENKYIAKEDPHAGTDKLLAVIIDPPYHGDVIIDCILSHSKSLNLDMLCRVIQYTIARLPARMRMPYNFDDNDYQSLKKKGTHISFSNGLTDIRMIKTYASKPSRR